MSERPEAGSVESESRSLAPLEPDNIAPIEREYEKIAITKEMFRKYHAPGASEIEIYFCMGKTRALDLDPLTNEVYYIRFPGKPYDAFVGYPYYVKKCFEAGLEHWEYEFDNDQKPAICTVTFYIKGREKPFKMITVASEVEARTKEGELNARWKKAYNFQLMKCAFVQTARFSGLLQKSLPYIPEEMGDPVASPDFRTITPDMIGEGVAPALPESAPEPSSVQPVEYHIDTSGLRRSYFRQIAGLFASDKERRAWQKEAIGVESASDWKVEQYALVFEKIPELIADRAEERPEEKAEEPEGQKGGEAEIQKAEEDDIEIIRARNGYHEVADGYFPDDKTRIEWERRIIDKSSSEEWSADEFAFAANRLESEIEELQKIEDEAEQEEEADTESEESDLLTEETYEKIRSEVIKLAPRFGHNLNASEFRNFAYDTIGGRFNSIKAISDEEGIMILEALQHTALAEKTMDEGKSKLEELAEEFEDDPDDPCTEAQQQEIRRIANEIWGAVGGITFRGIVSEAIGHVYRGIPDLTIAEAEKVISALNKRQEQTK